MSNAKRDNNRVTTLLAVSNADGTTPVVLWADPTTHRLLVSATAGDLGDLSNVTITGEAQGDVFYFNGTAWVNLPPGDSGKYLKTQGAAANPIWDTPVTGAAGNDTEVQFNDGGTSLGGDAGFVYNKTTNVGTIGGLLITGLTASEITATDASKNLVSLAVATYPSLAELAYVKGVTSAIQTQLDAKAPLDSPAFTTAIGTDFLTASEIVITDGSKNIISAPVATYPSLTELTYVKDVTSAIQTQIDAKGVGDALVANGLDQFAATTSLELKGVISDETGSGLLVFATSPALTTPDIGTPSAGTLTSCTGLPISTGVDGLGANVATFLATPSSANLITAVTDETGSGLLVFGTSPTLVTPTLGTPASGNLTNCTAASVTQKGPVELATTAEIDTGTDSTRAVPVDQFVASKRNIRWLVFNLVEAATDCATATNIAGDFVSPIAGTILQSDTTPFYLYATNSTAGVTGTMVVDISLGGTTIMTTNKLDFDTGEKTTTTAATPPDLTDTTIAVGDILTIDIDSIHTTAAKGLTVYMAIRE